VKPSIFIAERVHALNPRGAGGNCVVVQGGRVAAVTTLETARVMQKSSTSERSPLPPAWSILTST
jgi:hypothetical protein